MGLLDCLRRPNRSGTITSSNTGIPFTTADGGYGTRSANYYGAAEGVNPGFQVGVNANLRMPRTRTVARPSRFLNYWYTGCAYVFLNIPLYLVLLPVDCLPLLFALGLIGWSAQFLVSSPFETLKVTVLEYVYEYLITCPKETTPALEWFLSWFRYDIADQVVLIPMGDHDPSHYTMIPGRSLGLCYDPTPLCYDLLDFTSGLFTCNSSAAVDIYNATQRTPEFQFFMRNPNIFQQRKLIAGLSLVFFTGLFLLARRKEARFALINCILAGTQFLLEMFVRFPLVILSKPIIFLSSLLHAFWSPIPVIDISRLSAIPPKKFILAAVPTIEMFQRLTFHKFHGSSVFWHAFLMLIYAEQGAIAKPLMEHLDKSAKKGKLTELEIFSLFHNELGLGPLYKREFTDPSLYATLEEHIQHLTEYCARDDEESTLLRANTRHLIDLLFKAFQLYARKIMAKQLMHDRSYPNVGLSNKKAQEKALVLTALCQVNLTHRWYLARAWILNKYLGQGILSKLLNTMLVFPYHALRYELNKHCNVGSSTVLGSLLRNTGTTSQQTSAAGIVKQYGFLYTTQKTTVGMYSPSSATRDIALGSPSHAHAVPMLRDPPGADSDHVDSPLRGAVSRDPRTTVTPMLARGAGSLTALQRSLYERLLDLSLQTDIARAKDNLVTRISSMTGQFSGAPTEYQTHLRKPTDELITAFKSETLDFNLLKRIYIILLIRADAMETVSGEHKEISVEDHSFLTALKENFTCTDRIGRAQTVSRLITMINPEANRRDTVLDLRKPSNMTTAV